MKSGKLGLEGRIGDDVLQEKRAEYGRQILPTLSAKLTVEYGRDWNERNLAYMVRFAEALPNERIVSAMMRQSCDSVARMMNQVANLPEERIVVSLIRQLNAAQYLTVLAPKELLQEKLHKAIAIARRRLEEQNEELETLNAEPRELEERIAENVAKLLEGAAQ